MSGIRGWRRSRGLTRQHSPAFLALVEDARGRVRETDVATVRGRLARGDRFHLVDVREDEEWQRGRVAGAVHIGRGVLERDIEERIPDRAAEVVLYCGGGYRSVLAAEALQKMGYTNVLSMDGGYRGWTEAGLPTVGGGEVSAAPPRGAEGG